MHRLLEAHASSAGGLLGQYFDPQTGKAHKEHRSTITLGALRRCCQAERRAYRKCSGSLACLNPTPTPLCLACHMPC